MASHFSPPRTIVESHAFTADYDAFAGNERLNAVVSGLFWGIASNPLEFDLVPGNPGVRLAKSNPFDLGDGEIARIRVFFSVRSEGSVDLLFFDLEPVED